jgi:hypothetical protein
MKRLKFFLIIALFAGVSVAGVKYVAVVETDIDAQSGASATLTSADARLVTAELRREAVKNLPRDKYNIMTSETVQSMSGAVLEECAEENCVIALGSKIGADYIVRGTISKFQTMFTLTVEMYETENGTLVASSDPVRSEKVVDMLEKAASACAEMYRAFANEQRPVAPAPVPVPKPESVKAVAEPEPAKKAAEPEPAKKAAEPAKPAKAAKPERVAKKTAKPEPHPRPFNTQSADTVNVHREVGTVSGYSGVNNPANIAGENYLSVRAAVAPVLDGAITLSEIGVNVPISLYQTVGLTMLAEGAGAVYEGASDENGNLVPNTDSPLNNTNLMFSLAYAYRVWSRLAVGANLNFAYQTNFGDPLIGIGVDLGATYRLYKNPVFGEHTLGFAVQNLVAPAISASSLFDYNSADEYTSLRFSLFSEFLGKRICYAADFVVKDLFTDEYLAPSMSFEFNNKLGVNVWRVFKLYGLVGIDGHYGFAVSAKLSGVLGHNSVEAAYQYVAMGEENSEATTHTFYVRMEFGKHREEVFAGK